MVSFQKRLGERRRLVGCDDGFRTSTTSYQRGESGKNGRPAGIRMVIGVVGF